jgi:hypothetical protein
MDERMRRLWAAAEATELGWGGISPQTSEGLRLFERLGEQVESLLPLWDGEFGFRPAILTSLSGLLASRCRDGPEHPDSGFKFLDSAT